MGCGRCSMNDVTELRARYLALLDAEHREQIYQDIIEANTQLVEAVVVKNKASPVGITGRGHLMSNFHPDALKVKVRRSAAVPAKAS